jgi:hypothetical protein
VKPGQLLINDRLSVTNVFKCMLYVGVEEFNQFECRLLNVFLKRNGGLFKTYVDVREQGWYVVDNGMTEQ